MLEHYADARHALYAGWVLARAQLAGLDVQPITDADGDWTDRLEVRGTDGFALILAIPYPPDDWTLED